VDAKSRDWWGFRLPFIVTHSVHAKVCQASIPMAENNTYQVSQLLYSILVYIHGMKDVYIIFQIGDWKFVAVMLKPDLVKKKTWV
jgi:hypothetical protein